MDDVSGALADATNGTTLTNGAVVDISEEDREKAGIWKSGISVYQDGKATQPDDATGRLVTVSTATRYEWSDEFGDVVPRVPELEAELFHSAFLTRQGEHFGTRLTSIKVVAEATERPNPISSFATAGLHPTMLENVGFCGYSVPTPIQAYTIPAVLTDRDVVGVAQTGSGKTAAFLIPTMSKLMGKAFKICAKRPGLPGFNPETDSVRAEPLILVVVPTRELCIQIFDEARRLSYRSMLRPCIAYGGAPGGEQKAQLRRGCDILIGTPGRLVDFLSDNSLVSLSRLRYTIIDEADELLNADWSDEIEKLMSGFDSNEDANHRFLMFSATFNKELRSVAKKHLEPDYIIYVDGPEKPRALWDLLTSVEPGRSLIFVNSKMTCDRVDDFLYNRGLPTTSIHSERQQSEREEAIRGFRSGIAPILITTQVTGRGLDIKDVKYVVNFDLPSPQFGGIDEYVHRIGRTARIGNTGTAYSFYNTRDEDLANDLVKILIESNQKVPDFLEQYKPAEDVGLEFDDDSDAEQANGDAGEAGADAGEAGDAW
ncbi:MAG: hypothetical protein Q9227_001665 [Pyrenula ochraceoflavens]